MNSRATDGDAGTLALPPYPVTPVFPAPVSPGQIVSSTTYGNTVRQALIDLWANVQHVGTTAGAAVPATRQVIAGAGLTGGGALSADVTLAVDIVAAGGVPATRQIATGAGLTGGGDLSANRSLSVVDDTTVQRVRISQSGTLIAARREINFIPGSNVTLGILDDGPGNRVNVTISSTGSGGGGSQTPWVSHIDAATFELRNVGRVGIGTAAPAVRLHVVAAGVAATESTIARFTDEVHSTLEITAGDVSGANVSRVKAAGGMRLTVNSADVVTLVSDKAGIGTISPHLRLHVQGTFGPPSTSGGTQVYGIARFSQPSGAGVLDCGFGDSTAGWIQASSSADLAVKYPIALNPNGGDVMIGYLDPTTTRALSVRRPAGIDTSLMLWQLGVASGMVGFLPSDNKLYIANTGATGVMGATTGVVIDQVGNVGVGVVPEAETRLNVSGRIHATNSLPGGSAVYAVHTGSGVADNAGTFVNEGATAQVQYGIIAIYGNNTLSGNRLLGCHSLGVTRFDVAADGGIRMWLGGALKTLSVDGSGFVKAA
jgi:hypothetical protein